MASPSGLPGCPATAAALGVQGYRGPVRKVESPALENSISCFCPVQHDARVEVHSGLVQSKALLVLPDLVRRGARRNQGGNVLPALVRCSRFGSTLAGIAPSARNGRRSGSLRSPACGSLPAGSSALGVGSQGGGAPRGPGRSFVVCVSLAQVPVALGTGADAGPPRPVERG